MNIIHICNDFAGSKVHSQLYSTLDRQGIHQTVFCPIRHKDLYGKNNFESDHTLILYANIIKPYHKYCYHIKIKQLFNYLQQHTSLTDYHLCHASTLFSDGGIAYYIYNKYHIPYIVNIRSTDVNVFLSRMPHTWPMGKQILLHADKICFISQALMDNFCQQKAIQPILKHIKDKFILMPNGIDNYYLEHIHREATYNHNILYVGNFSANKNVPRLMQAVLQLKQEPSFHDIHLTLVGGDQQQHPHINALISQHANTFSYLGPIYDQATMCMEMRKHSLLAMPSIYETFGLVYIEALSQGLPVIYSQHQAVDGMLGPQAGKSVDPLSVHDIAQAIAHILEHRSQYTNADINFLTYQWEHISEKYIAEYNHIISTNTL